MARLWIVLRTTKIHDQWSIYKVTCKSEGHESWKKKPFSDLKPLLINLNSLTRVIEWVSYHVPAPEARMKVQLVSGNEINGWRWFSRTTSSVRKSCAFQWGLKGCLQMRDHAILGVPSPSGDWLLASLRYISSDILKAFNHLHTSDSFVP